MPLKYAILFKDLSFPSGSKTNSASWIQTVGAAVHSMKWHQQAAPSALGMVVVFTICFKGLKELSADKYSVCLCVRG